MNGLNCLRLRRVNAAAQQRKDGSKKSAQLPGDVLRQLPSPLTASVSTTGQRETTSTSSLSSLDSVIPRPPPAPVTRDTATAARESTYIPLGECFSGSRPTSVSDSSSSTTTIGNMSTCAVASPQVTTALRQQNSVLGTDAFLLDIVPPSPCRFPHVQRPALQLSPTAARDRGRDAPRPPTIHPHRPYSATSSPRVHQHNVIVPPSGSCATPTTPRRLVASHVITSTMRTSTSSNCSPSTSRRHRLLVGSGLLSVDDELMSPPDCPPPPPPLLTSRRAVNDARPGVSQSAVQSPVLDSAKRDHRRVGDILSRSTGVLNVCPPAPHLPPYQVKLHRYINASPVTVIDHSTAASSPPPSPAAVAASVDSDLDVIRPHRQLDRGFLSGGVVNDEDGDVKSMTMGSSTLPLPVTRGRTTAQTYYNDIASPGFQSSWLDYCNVSEVDTGRSSPLASRPSVGDDDVITDDITLPIKYSTSSFDSSTDDDDDDSCRRLSASSKTSLDQLVAPMSSAALTHSNDVINYLTLDLDDATSPTRSSPKETGLTSTMQTRESVQATVYGDIDWFRTRALNDMRKQVETIRQTSTSGSACLLAVNK